jgi:predicted RNase H-like HicB family nuclease
MKSRRARPREITIVFTSDGAWWIAEAPSIPGAHSQGRTIQSARRNLFSAIKELRETYATMGRKLPVTDVKVERYTLEKLVDA